MSDVRSAPNLPESTVFARGEMGVARTLMTAEPGVASGMECLSSWSFSPVLCRTAAICVAIFKTGYVIACSVVDELYVSMSQIQNAYLSAFLHLGSVVLSE